MKADICFTECFNPVKLILECVYEAACDSKLTNLSMEAQSSSFIYAEVELPFEEICKQTLVFEFEN